MIDHTSDRIEKLETAVRRENRRRYAFYRMLQATDRVRWRLEEMNRDGVKTIPPKVGAENRRVGVKMVGNVRGGKGVMARGRKRRSGLVRVSKWGAGWAGHVSGRGDALCG